MKGRPSSGRPSTGVWDVPVSYQDITADRRQLGAHLHPVGHQRDLGAVVLNQYARHRPHRHRALRHQLEP
jgi:hypothetical protein